MFPYFQEMTKAIDLMIDDSQNTNDLIQIEHITQLRRK